jgi:hypothetical protein
VQPLLKITTVHIVVNTVQPHFSFAAEHDALMASVKNDR